MSETYTIDANRMMDRIQALGQIGRTADGGVHRMALSKEDFAAQQLVWEWMQEAGMTVRRDDFGNLVGRIEGKEPKQPVIMMGSHIDSVPNGGIFDGTIGVIGAIEVVQAIRDANLQMSCPIEVVAFCDEEGPRFHGGLFGSRAMIGTVTESELQKRDDAGISRYEALQSFGLNPQNAEASVRKPGEIKVYLEMHIEQGPYLQSVNRPVGIVTGIAGPTWLGVKLIGEEGHAGTVPMTLRKDPMVGAAEIIQSIETICSAEPTATTVGTVGWILAKPGGGNVIPNSVEFSADIRDIDNDRRHRVISQIKDKIDKVCRRRELQAIVEENLNVAPTHCSAHVIETMEKANQELDLMAPKMVSGAGHDAMLMAKITDIGMIFVRCRDGISHSPKEWAEKEDIAKGTTLLMETVLRYSQND